jgi:RNA polymerase sigma-70 factor, ECF subfamily
VSDPSDEALLAAHLRGDPRAFGQLVARHERRVYGLCLRILGNREDAEDATQEAFLAALRRAASFRRAAAFSTWLYRIAVNAATDQARRRGRARLAPLDPEDAGLAVAPGGELGEVVASAVVVQTALAKVPEEFRVAVVLCDLYRIPYPDAAQILEIPVGTVKSRVFRGRLALAECLRDPPDRDPDPTRLQEHPDPDPDRTRLHESPDPDPDRPPLRVLGRPGTDARSPASEPTDPDHRPQE